LIVSGAIDAESGADSSTPMGWVLGRLDATKELRAADNETVELEREGARLLIRLDRFSAEPELAPEPVSETEQLSLFEQGIGRALPEAPTLPPLVPLPHPPLHRVRRLSFTALALYESCSYRYFAERVAGLRPALRPLLEGETGLAATEIGSAVHSALESIDLNAPAVPHDLEAQIRARLPSATGDELERIRGFVEAYCDSELAARVAGLESAEQEPGFTFEHDGVLLHGFLDVYHRSGTEAFVLDYKTNALGDEAPEEIVERDYRLQRLVYALACFRAGAEEVEVAYQFLERPDEIVSTTFTAAQAPELEAELSDAIARIQAGEFRPMPSELVCADCPALDLVCAGPRLPVELRAVQAGALATA
jgi:ATP-dependent helicase/nuclease subunit A